MGPNTALEAIKSQIRESEIVLYMEGTREALQLSFSSAMSKILADLKLLFMGLNVLQSTGLREGFKEFTNWPTIRQLYVKKGFLRL
jgi:monothiol glutaredoxin